MNYFITGGTGFIGTHLANLLHEVHPEAKIYNLDIIAVSYTHLTLPTKA